MAATIAKRYPKVNSIPLVPSHSKLLCNALVNEVKEIRRARMLMLAVELGSLEALAERTGTSARHLSQIKNRWKDRGMGRTLARRFDAKLGKPLGWMDQPLPQASDAVYSTDRSVSEGKVQSPRVYGLDPERQEMILDLFDQLTRSQQDEFLSRIKTSVEDNKAVVREFAQRPASDPKRPPTRKT
jgi:hypothetical protein